MHRVATGAASPTPSPTAPFPKINPQPPVCRARTADGVHCAGQAGQRMAANATWVRRLSVLISYGRRDTPGSVQTFGQIQD